MTKQVVNPALTLDLGFSDKDKALMLLRSLALDRRVTVNIMKARITERAAWLELEVDGQDARRQEVATLLNEAASVKDPNWRPVSRAS